MLCRVLPRLFLCLILLLAALFIILHLIRCDSITKGSGLCRFYFRIERNKKEVGLRLFFVFGFGGWSLYIAAWMAAQSAGAAPFVTVFPFQWPK